MNVLSLFDGMSCGQIALERAGIKVDKYFASEVDKYAIQVTQKNFPDTVQLGDITQLKSADLPQIDLLIGGSPCQGFSFAGKQLNFDDPRSALFFEYVRLLKECKPKYFLLENVVMKQEHNDVISRILGGIYPEYTTQQALFGDSRLEPIQINSALVSAQTRKRLYWTNIPDAYDCFYDEKNSDTVEDILEDEVDIKYYIEPKRAVIILENEVRRRKIAYIGTDSQDNRIYSIHGKAVTLCGGAKTGLYALPCLTPDRLEKRQNGIRFKPPKSKFYTLTAQDKHGVLVDNHIRKLTPIECERLQTVPDGYTEGVSDNQRYKMIGNGWTVDVIVHIFEGLKELKRYE